MTINASNWVAQSREQLAFRSSGLCQTPIRLRLFCIPPVGPVRQRHQLFPEGCCGTLPRAYRCSPQCTGSNRSLDFPELVEVLASICGSKLCLIFVTNKMSRRESPCLRGCSCTDMFSALQSTCTVSKHVATVTCRLAGQMSAGDAH